MFKDKEFTPDELRAQLRTIVEDAVRRNQVKKLFGADNDLSDVEGDAAVVAQAQALYREKYGDGNFTFLRVSPEKLVATGTENACFLVQGVMGRTTEEKASNVYHLDAHDGQSYKQLCTRLQDPEHGPVCDRLGLAGISMSV